MLFVPSAVNKRMSFIFDEFHAEEVVPEDMDLLWENGFRHFGTHFYRYSHSYLNDEVALILPLRILLSEFKMTESQKRVIRKNKDTTYTIRDCVIDQEKEDLFYIHRERFTSNVPESIYTFLSSDPAKIPCNTKEVCVYRENRLIAVSFMDMGKSAASSVYAMFDPAFNKKSLGIYTMLLEIDYSKEQGFDYLYPGYAFREQSFYDYKKNFHPAEYYNWDEERWLPYEV